jgi:hypothetical protein
MVFFHLEILLFHPRTDPPSFRLTYSSLLLPQQKVDTLFNQANYFTAAGTTAAIYLAD